MKRPTTHLGNRELHRRHAVMIEGGVLPRAKVMDQHVIDRLLMENMITLRQHRAGDYMLGQAARAGIWATGANLSGSGGGKPGTRVPFGIFPLGNTIKCLRDHCGDKIARIVFRVVCHDEVPKELDPLQAGLDCIADHRMGGYIPPHMRLQLALDRK